MRWFMVLATLAIVIILISVISTVAFKAVELSRDFETRELIELDKESINSISLDFRNSPHIELQRDFSGKWEIVSPMRGPANTPNALLVREALYEMKVQSKLSDSAEARPSDQEIGLDQPRAVITLVNSEGQKSIISILNVIPRRKESYVKLQNDDEIYCVSPDPTNTIQLSLDELRSKKLIDLSQADIMMVNSIEAMGQSEFSLKRDSSENWTISGAKYGSREYPARPEAVKSLLSSISNIEIMSVNTEAITDLERFGFGDPWQSFKLKFEPLAGKSDIDISISANTGTMFASLNKQLWLVQLKSDSGRDTIRDFWSMVQRYIFNVSADEIISINIVKADQERIFSRDSAGWSGPKDSANSITLDMSAGKLASLQFESVIESYMKLSGFGLEAPESKISFKLADGQSQTLLIGSKSPAAGRIYVKTEQEDSVYTVNGAIIEQITALAE